MSYQKRLNRLLVGNNRGKNVMQVFRKYKEDFSKLEILDVGCGFGSLSFDFSHKFKKVHSIDGLESRIEGTKLRLNKNNVKNVLVFKDNALNIKSTRKKFDIVHLTGVFEWLRAGNLNKSAYFCQNQFLKNIKKNMGEDAILYSGTENLFFPYYWLKDPHNNNWPFFVLFPEFFSDFIFKLFNKRYVARIYSYWKLKKMFKRHFKKVDFYVPIPHYQYVFSFANINDKKSIICECRKVLKTRKLDKMQKFTIYWILWTSRFGLIKLFSPGFITVAKK